MSYETEDMKLPNVQLIIYGPVSNLMKLTRIILFPLQRWGNQRLKSPSVSQSRARHTDTHFVFPQGSAEWRSVSAPNPHRSCLFNINGPETDRDSVIGGKKDLCKVSSSTTTPVTPRRIIMAIIHQKRRSDNYKDGISSYHLASQHGH